MSFSLITGGAGTLAVAAILLGYFIRFIGATRGLDTIDHAILPSQGLLALLAVVMIYSWLMLGTWFTSKSAHSPQKSKAKNDERAAADPMFPYPIMTRVGLWFYPLLVLCMFFIIARTPTTRPDVIVILLGSAYLAAMAYGLFFPGLSFIFGLLVKNSASNPDIT